MKPRIQKVRHLMLALTIISVSVGVFRSEMVAATYYISPTGSDSNSGNSSTTPWRTFSFAIPKLNPGDSLYLRDGTYTSAVTGFPNIACASNAANGTASSRITIKAENERRAFLQGDGSVIPFAMSNCSYWTVEGLRIKSADFNGPSNGDAMVLQNSNNLILRRLLLSHNNRYKNSHLIQANTVSNCLFEEIEMYYFHRHGLSLSVNSNGNIARRCYSNSRLYPDIAGGYASGNSRGDESIAVYPGSNNIIENCISENNDNGYTVNAAGTSQNNKILGSISLNDVIGIRLQARGTSLGFMPQNTTIQNVVVINPVSVGIYARSSKNTRVDNVSILGGGPNGGLVADIASPETGDGAPTTFSNNTLVSSVTGARFNLLTQYSFLIDYPNSFGSGTAFNPAVSHAGITNAITIDPVLGSCRLWIPSASPMKGTGKDGANIGADILYRYESGALTNQPLWDPITGRFPVGALVGGLNDMAGSSGFDVHLRLNVNSNGCSFPTSYGPGQTSQASPSNLRIVQ